MKNFILLLFLLIHSFCNAQWQQSNGPGGGAITSFFSNGSQILVGTYEGALYKSDPDGNNRELIKPNRNNVNANQVYKLGNRIYFHYQMSNESFFSDDDGLTWNIDTTNERPIFYKDGIFFRDNSFSIDTGNSWINNSTFGNINSYGFRNNNETFIEGNNKFYRTINNGQSWDTLIFSSMPIGTIIKSGSNYISTMGEISLDSGSTWNAIPTFAGLQIKDIQHDNYSIYVLTQTSGLFVSPDNGINWIQITSHLPYNLLLDQLFADGENVFVSGIYEGVFSSTDHGLTWHNINQNLNSSTTTKIIVADSLLFAGTFAGLFKSTDQGMNWTKIEIIPEVNSFTVSEIFQYKGELLIVCGEKTLRSSNSGNTWTELNYGTPIYNSQYCLAENDSFLFSSGFNGLFISSDTGSTWTRRSSAVSFSTNTIAVLNQNIFLAQWDSLAISNDNGITFRKSQNIVGPIMNVQSHNNKIYVCSQTEGILSSSDSGSTWTNVFNRRYLQNFYITDSIIWAPNILSLIYYSLDGGLTFDSIGTPDYTTLNPYYTSRGFLLHSGNIYAGMYAGGIWRIPYPNLLNSVLENKFEKPALYPNPASNSITIQRENSASPFVYFIFDSAGRRIKKGLTFGTIDISYLKAGEYYFSTGEISTSGLKFMKIN